MVNSDAPRRFRISNANQIPSEWGSPRVAKRRTTVRVREPVGMESFATSWGALTATPGSDLIVVEGSGEEYPVKKEIFAKTYEAVAQGRFRKKAASRLIQVPIGAVALLATLEGDIEVTHPDWVVIGGDGEVYANSAEWVAANLEFIV